MDFSTYSESTRELNEKVRACLKTGDKRARTYLRKMLKSAVEANDPVFTGFVYHQLAYVEYFIFGHYEAFLRNLQRSASVLLRVGGEELINVYYLVGIDALNKGMYDVSFRYFQMARNLAADTGHDDYVAILDESIGYTLLHLEDYSLSRVFTKQAMRTLKKLRSHPHYYENLATGYLNDAVACVKLGKIARARWDYEQIEKLFDEMQNPPADDMRFCKALLAAHLAVSEKKFSRIAPCIGEICAIIPLVPQIVENIEDIKRLCDELFDCGERAAVGEILSALENVTIAQSATNSRRIVADLRVSYYLEGRHGKKLFAAFAEQDEVYARMIVEQSAAYRYVRELIQMTEKLQHERVRIHEENEALTHRVRTDALTGIANRYGLNQYLEEVFETAFRKGTLLGVSVLDVDGLKEYNDTRGHLAGDIILQDIGHELQRLMQSDAHVFAARYGGDEFVIVYDGKKREEILKIASGLQKDIPIGVTQGICLAVPANRQKSWDYLACADRALYQGKRKRGEILFTSPK